MGIHKGDNNESYWAPEYGDWVVIWQASWCIVGKIVAWTVSFPSGFSLEANSMVVANADMISLEKFLVDGVVLSGKICPTECVILERGVEILGRWPHERLPLIVER